MNFLKKMLPKIYIILVPGTHATIVYAQVHYKNSVIKQFDRQSFESASSLKSYIQTLERESTLSYIVLLACHPKQGLLSSCTLQDGVDMSSVEKVCYDHSWGIYMDKDDIFELQKQYRGVGLDLLFSPYTLLTFEHREMIKQISALYLLITPKYMVAMVFKDKEAYFAEKLEMPEELEREESQTVSEHHIKNIEQLVKQFYKESSNKMFIESIIIADATGLDATFEHTLEERLFVEVTKETFSVEETLISLANEELGCQ